MTLEKLSCHLQPNKTGLLVSHTETKMDSRLQHKHMKEPDKKKKEKYIKGITTHSTEGNAHNHRITIRKGIGTHVTVLSVYNYTLSCKMALAILTNISSYESKKGSKIAN